MKSAMHKIKLREDKDQKRKERTAKLVASGKYDADEETRQAWKRHRQSSEAFGLNDDGTPREGAGVQGLPQYKIKNKTPLQRRNQMNRAKVRNEESSKPLASKIYQRRKAIPGGQPMSAPKFQRREAYGLRRTTTRLATYRLVQLVSQMHKR